MWLGNHHFSTIAVFQKMSPVHYLNSKALRTLLLNQIHPFLTNLTWEMSRKFFMWTISDYSAREHLCVYPSTVQVGGTYWPVRILPWGWRYIHLAFHPHLIPQHLQLNPESTVQLNRKLTLESEVWPRLSPTHPSSSVLTWWASWTP